MEIDSSRHVNTFIRMRAVHFIAATNKLRYAMGVSWQCPIRC
jgi:hypothetical protein